MSQSSLRSLFRKASALWNIQRHAVVASSGLVKRPAQGDLRQRVERQRRANGQKEVDHIRSPCFKSLHSKFEIKYGEQNANYTLLGSSKETCNMQGAATASTLLFIDFWWVTLSFSMSSSNKLDSFSLDASGKLNHKCNLSQLFLESRWRNPTYPTSHIASQCALVGCQRSQTQS